MKYLFLLLTVSCLHIGYCQTPVTEGKDTTQAISVAGSQQLTRTEFKQIINQQFSYLLGGENKSAIGNFASLDLKESAFTFAGSVINKKGSVFGVNLSGGVTDGVADLFTNSKLNTKVALDFQYNSLSLGTQQIDWFTESRTSYLTKKSKIEDEYERNILAINAGKPRNDLLLKLQKLQKKRDGQIVGINTLKNQIDSLGRLPGYTENPFDLASIANLQYDLTLSDRSIDSTKTALDSFPRIENLIEQEDNRRATQITALDKESRLTVIGFSFGWWSVGYKVKRNDFKYFDGSKQFEKQIMDTSFVTHEIRLTRSHYKWTTDPYKSFYISGGLGIAYTDNFDSGDLTKVEISETKNYGPNSGARSVTSKYNAYQGVYEPGSWGVRLFADYYRFLFNGNTGAVHLFPEILAQQKSAPTYNFGIGLLFPFKNPKDETSIVNAELYYNFLDLFNVQQAAQKAFQRNSIGIRFTFPIKFKNS